MELKSQTTCIICNGRSSNHRDRMNKRELSWLAIISTEHPAFDAAQQVCNPLHGSLPSSGQLRRWCLSPLSRVLSYKHKPLSIRQHPHLSSSTRQGADDPVSCWIIVRCMLSRCKATRACRWTTDGWWYKSVVIYVVDMIDSADAAAMCYMWLGC